MTVVFIIWKLLLLSIACTSPYPGYDTSTTLLFPGKAQNFDVQGVFKPALRNLISKLTRWDAIYFAQIAHRGAQFEQEWAFGWGFAKLLKYLSWGT